MIRSSAIAILTLACVCVLGSGVVGVPEDVGVALASLNPADVRGYLDAGDLLASDPETHRLAQETLAIGLQIASRGDPVLASSFALALSALSEAPDQRDALRRLAIELDPTRAEALSWLARGDAASFDRQSRDCAEVLGGIRRNEPRAVEGMTPELRRVAVSEADRLGYPRRRFEAVLDAWMNDARDDPCRGRRVVQRRDRDRTEAAACPDPSYHHDAHPGADLDMMLAVELSLRGVVPDAWDTRLALRIDPPVPTCTPESVGGWFGVSPDRPLRRGDRWVAR